MKKIMIIGTSSGAGKSITVAGLCRIFYRDGYKVAPFKSQNMALNSYITKDGCEIGRAQALQAIACNKEPIYQMNPILLKPTGDRKIQVIINGKSIGNMGGIEYSKYKISLKSKILDAYKKLEKENEICVIEGAGSPVELNMRENDIVNMGLAEMLDTPVILVADIDRGGVFASIYGTLELMKPEEKKRVIGVIINKFRGDVKILEPGLKEIEKLTKVPILGVIPYFDLDIEDEDGVTEKFNKKIVKNKKVIISVIKLKHISNFTDLNPLEIEEDVEVNYINKASELGEEDIIIIPGSKNTIDDLKDLKEKGIGTQIIKLARKGVPVIGICGGFQILGQKVSDPFGIEGEIKEIPGLSLLNIETTIEREKVTKQYKGILKGDSGILNSLGEIEIEGYEIHQGITKGKMENLTKDKRVVACIEDNIFGTYIHGIFDNIKFKDYYLNLIRRKKGVLEKENKISYKEHRILELDKLSDILKKNLDIEEIYKKIGVK